jgi:5-keto 4-deoxyuronate isomerase
MWSDMYSDFENVSDRDSIHRSVTVTDLRQNKDYTTYYSNWTRLIVIGVVPMLLLIYFNYKVT